MGKKEGPPPGYDVKKARKHLEALKAEVDQLRVDASSEKSERSAIRWGQLDALGTLLQSVDSIL